MVSLGAPLRTVAECLGVSQTTVTRWCRELGLVFTNPHAQRGDLARLYGLPSGLKPRAVMMLLALATGPKPMPEIGAAMGLTRTQTLFRPLAALRRAGLVCKLNRQVYCLSPEAMDILEGNRAQPDPRAAGAV
jgi:biotin operon repressor